MIIDALLALKLSLEHDTWTRSTNKLVSVLDLVYM